MAFRSVLSISLLVLIFSGVALAQDVQSPLSPPSVLAEGSAVDHQSAAAFDEFGIESTSARRSAANRAYRQEIRSMDVLDRPYRNVFHVYGNTVRRRHERGAFPLRSIWQ